jgi:hypothetical protein
MTIEDLIGNLIYARSGWGDWAKGARVVEVMEAAQLSLAESPRYTSQLWRQLVKDQRTWLTASLIEVIDGEYQRDLWGWFKGLDLMRATHEPRT